MIILGSRSQVRARLLLEAGVLADVRPTDVDEAGLKASALAAGQSPRAVAEALATAKSLAVTSVGDGLAIGADQTLDLDGQLFDKPNSLAEARSHLLALRGRRHRLHAAIAVASEGAVVWRTVQTATLHMRAFSDAFLDRYLEKEGEELLSSVGAYRLEGLGVQLFEEVEGDYFTVLGLPLLPLLTFLRGRGCLPA